MRAQPLSVMLAAMAGPLAWFLHLSVLYGAATLLCTGRQSQTAFVAIAVLATLVALAGLALFCMAQWRGLKRREEEAPGRRFLATLGLALGLMSMLAMAWTAVPAALLGCAG